MGTKHIIGLFSFIVSIAFCNAQVIKGRFIDSDTKKPVPYAGVGVLHSAIGTVSDSSGNFKLDLIGTKESDTLKISAIGYMPAIIPLSHKELMVKKRDTSYLLQPESTTLTECTIIAGEQKEITEGNDIKSSMVCVGFSSSKLGTEIGTVLRYSKKTPGRIENVNFNLEYSAYDSVKCRVNIYNYSDGVVGSSVLTKPIDLVINSKGGLITIDLKDKNIYINNDALLTLEWVDAYGTHASDSAYICRLHFNAGFLNSPSYERKTCQSDWKKVPAGGGFWATIGYRK